MNLSFHQRGIGLMIVAVVFFASLDALTKHLTLTYSVIGVLFVRYLAHALLLAIRFGPVLRFKLVRSRHPRIQVLRALLLLATSWFVVNGLQRLPLAEVTAIVFLYPVMVAALSHLLFGERLGVGGWTAALMGFGGVLVMVRPTEGQWNSAVLFPLAGAVCQSFYMILTRKVSTGEHPVTTNFITGCVGALLTGVLVWTAPVSLPLPAIGTAITLGLLALSGHYLLTLACNLAPIAVVAPIAYSQLIVAAAIGYLVFGALPDAWSLLGMAIIAGSGAYLIHSQSPGVRPS